MFTGSAFEAAGSANSSAILEEVPGMAVCDTPKGTEEYLPEGQQPGQVAPDYREVRYPGASRSGRRRSSLASRSAADKALTTIPADDLG